MSVSFIIPSRHEMMMVNETETVLQRMVRDIHEKATGDFEVVVVYDGEPYQNLPDYPNLVVLKTEQAGTKTAVNRGAEAASGKYLFKLDSHCMVGPDIDKILSASMQDNWVVMPRFYVLDAENWKWQDNRFYDYFRLPCPLTDKKGFRFQAGGHWKERTKERLDIPIDENMKLHGSCFFMSRKFFWDALGGLDPNNGAGPTNGEDIEISLKTWLGPWDGKVIVNKNTWYAHMHRGGQRPREFPVSERQAHKSALWTADYWMGNSWPERVRDTGWLIDKFFPVPGWPDDWRRRHGEYLYAKYGAVKS